MISSNVLQKIAVIDIQNLLQSQSVVLPIIFFLTKVEDFSLYIYDQILIFNSSFSRS